MNLPTLQDLYYKALFTFYKGVNIGETDYNSTYTFENVILDKNNLLDYKNLFNFESELPISYLYLIAQRAQVFGMVRSEFPIAIPGLIHLENEIEKFDEIDVNSSFDLKVEIEIESKKEGSLIPIFQVNYIQNKVKVATCKSIYIAKRKNRNKPKILNTKVIEKIGTSVTVFDKVFINKYIQISGDKNPIHSNYLIARIFGFKNIVVHGWVVASKFFSIIEKKEKEIKKINCIFHKPNYLDIPLSYSSITNLEVFQGDNLTAEIVFS